MIKIGIVEDHHMLRTALVNLLNENGDFKVVLEAANGKELFNRILYSELPKVILIDVDMPEMDGPTTVAAFRKKFGNKTKLLGLSIHKEERLIKEMIDNGEDGFINKSVTADELIHAITQVVSTGCFLSGNVAKYVKRIKNPIVKQDLLSPIEEEILRLICQEKTNIEIAKHLNYTINTVNTYRTRMIEKLEVRNSVGLVLYALQHGIYRIK